ncbi:MAG: DUF563 domain-containing protein [Sedimentitalea sp.]
MTDHADTQPLPEGGWSEALDTFENATVVPPLAGGFVQPAGLLDAQGGYIPQGALWRKFRPLTTQPEQPAKAPERLSGRWLWGGVLWAHFGHFLVESTARLWALNHLDGPIDGILFIPKRPRSGDQVRGFQREFVDLMGHQVPIKVAADPVQVDQLIVPGQGFGLGPITQGTPKFRAAIHQAFARDVKPEGAEKLYISRSALGLGKGGLLGEERLEQHLSDQGYHIYHPQQHTITEQLAQYKAAKQVVAADGSALHLFAMVGRQDQPVAMILRRQSSANNLLAVNVRAFCGNDTLVINALRTEWLKANAQRSSRLSFGELDHTKISKALGDAGFVAPDSDWPMLTDAERAQLFQDKKLTDNDQFIESPRYVRLRVKAMRQQRRAS